MFLGIAEVHCCGLFLFVLHGILLNMSPTIYLPILPQMIVYISVMVSTGSGNILINVSNVCILRYILQNGIYIL